MLTRAVWPKPEAVEALKKVVPLAVHRYREDPKDPKAHPPSEWAIRFDVMAYPQFRFVDGHGKALQISSDVARTVAGLQDAVARAVAALPEGVGTDGVRWSDLSELDWIPTETEPRRLRDLVRRGQDPVVQLMALDRLAALRAVRELGWALRLAIWENNDWVRGRALRLLPMHPDREEAAELAKVVITRVLGKRTARFHNPNNMLMAALRAAKELADPTLVPALARVVSTRSGNNMATLNAVEALVAIGKAEGMETVAQALGQAKKVEGRLAPRIRELIDSVKQ